MKCSVVTVSNPCRRCQTRHRAAIWGVVRVHGKGSLEVGLGVRLIFLAHMCQAAVDGIHRALAAVAVAAVRALGVVVDEPAIKIGLEDFRSGVQALT
jgi:hypothetical protein